MSKEEELRNTQQEALRLVRNAARQDRERILFQDRVDRAYADEVRRTRRALEWQRDPMRVTARKTGGVVRILYYIALVILIPLTLGIVLIPHFFIKKLIFDKRR